MKDLRAVLDHKPKSLLVMNVEDKEQLTAYFEVSLQKSYVCECLEPFLLLLTQSFGGLLQVEVDPENDKNFIFTFRHAHIAQKVQYMYILTLTVLRAHVSLCISSQRTTLL